MNIAHLLRRSGEVHADRPALWVGDKVRLDYRSLARRAAGLAGFLSRRRGVMPGDRVLIFASNVPEYLEALHAIYWAGAASVPVNCKLHAKELSHVLDDAEPRIVLASVDMVDAALEAGATSTRLLVLGSPEYNQALAEESGVLEPRHPDDLASLFYTSGTTGRPKGVMQTHRNLLAMTSCYFSDVDDVQALDAMVYAAPMSHGAGLYNFSHVLRGARHVVPASGGFDPAELLALSRSIGRLTFFAAPTMVRRLVRHLELEGGDALGIKTIVYGGGPMYVEDIKAALRVIGPRLVQIYGQGETPMTITALSREHLADAAHPRWEQRAASVGVVQSQVELRVADANDESVPTGEVGEILVRGETVMAGYWRSADASIAALNGGWLHTGDLGFLDEEGFLTLRDRSKDLIISGGSNIYPREVEEVLLAHPAVTEVAVVGQRDAEWGEVVAAFVVLDKKRPVEANELDAWCLQNLARFKRPKTYRFVDGLPKSGYGKILKTSLRQQLDGSGL